MGKTELYRQLTEKQNESREYYLKARQGSKTAQEQQYYFKLMFKAEDEAKAIRRQIQKIDDEERKQNDK